MLRFAWSADISVVGSWGRGVVGCGYLGRGVVGSWGAHISVVGSWAREFRAAHLIGVEFVDDVVLELDLFPGLHCDRQLWAVRSGLAEY